MLVLCQLSYDKKIPKEAIYRISCIYEKSAVNLFLENVAILRKCFSTDHASLGLLSKYNASSEEVQNLDKKQAKIFFNMFDAYYKEVLKKKHDIEASNTREVNYMILNSRLRDNTLIEPNRNPFQIEVISNKRPRLS